MKYALLIYTKPGEYDQLSEAERQSVRGEYMALAGDPRCVESAQLQPIETATSVRVQDGQRLTTDGPFADTKEVFAGYYVYDVDDLDAALDAAAKVPATRLGGVVEVRPVVEQPS